MIKKILLILLTIISIEQLHAQYLSGVVINAKTKAPIENATIKIANSKKGTISDPKGEFKFNTTETTIQQLNVSCIGYETETITLPNFQETNKVEVKLNPTSFQLNRDIIVTASRNKTSSFNSPDAITVVNNLELNNNSPRSMAEALIGATGVWMQKTNHGGGSPFVRGLTGNQTLLLVDGIRLNNSTFRYGPNQYFNTIDVFSVEQVEIVRGKGSVLYGSDALGGVINVLTRTPEFISTKPKLSGKGKLKYISKGMEYSGAGELVFQSKKFSILANTSYKKFGDIFTGGKPSYLSPSGYNEKGINLKSKLRLAKNLELISAYQYLTQNKVPRYDQIAQRGYKTYLFDPQIHQLFYAQLNYFSNNSFFRKIKLNYANQLSDETRIKQKKKSPFTTFEVDVVRTNSLAAEVFSVLNEKWEATSGIEFYTDRIKSKKTIKEASQTTKKRGLYPNNASMSNLAIFSQHTLTFAKVELQMGGRYNTFLIQSEDNEFGKVKLNPSALVGNFSFSFIPNSENRLILSVNSAFRAPNINDISSFGTFDYGIEVPSNKLSPEKSITLETGYKHKTKQFAFSLFAFNMRLQDQIVRVKSSYNGNSKYQGEQVYTKKNIAKSNLLGVELESGLKLNSNFSLTNNLTWLYGENLENNKPMRRIPPLNGKLAIRYVKSKLFSEIGFLFASKQSRLSGGDIDDHRIPKGGTPGWKVVNFKTAYRLNKLSIHAGIQNIFNENYRIHGSGIDAYGRSFWLSLILKI